MQCIVYEISPDSLPIYTKVQGEPAFVVGEEGRNILAVTKPGKVVFPMFDIVAPKATALAHFRAALRERTAALEKCLDEWLVSRLLDEGGPLTRNEFTRVLVLKRPAVLEVNGQMVSHVGLGLVRFCQQMPFESDEQFPVSAHDELLMPETTRLAHDLYGKFSFQG